MPVLTVRGRRRGDGGDNLDERVGAGGLPEADGAGAEVDVVGEVVPGVRDQLRGPLGDTAHVPTKEVIRGSLFT